MKQYKLLSLLCMSMLSGIAFADNVFVYVKNDGFSNVQFGGQSAKLVSTPQGNTSNSVQGAEGIGGLSQTLNDNIRTLQQGEALTIKYNIHAPDGSNYGSFNLYKNNQLVTPNGFAYAPSGAKSPFNMFYVQADSKYWQQVTFKDSDTIYIMLDGVPYDQYKGTTQSVTLDQDETITSFKIDLLGTMTDASTKEINPFTSELDLSNAMTDYMDGNVLKKKKENLLSLITGSHDLVCTLQQSPFSRGQCKINFGSGVTKVVNTESYTLQGKSYNSYVIAPNVKIVGVSMTYTTSKNSTPKTLTGITTVNFARSAASGSSAVLTMPNMTQAGMSGAASIAKPVSKEMYLTLTYIGDQKTHRKYALFNSDASAKGLDKPTNSELNTYLSNITDNIYLNFMLISGGKRASTARMDFGSTYTADVYAVIFDKNGTFLKTYKLNAGTDAWGTASSGAITNGSINFGVSGALLVVDGSKTGVSFDSTAFVKVSVASSSQSTGTSQLSVDGSVHISDLSKFTQLWFSPVFTIGGFGEYPLSSANFNTAKSALSAGPVEVSFVMTPSGSNMSGKIVAMQGVTKLFEQPVDTAKVSSAAKIARVNLTTLGGIIGGVGNKAMSSTVKFYPPVASANIASMTPQQIASQLNASQKSELLKLLGSPQPSTQPTKPIQPTKPTQPSSTSGDIASIVGNKKGKNAIKALVNAVKAGKITKEQAKDVVHNYVSGMAKISVAMNQISNA